MNPEAQLFEPSEEPITHVMDTALWVATFRTRESERPQPLFEDPYAKLLTDGKGESLVGRMKFSGTMEWSIVMRTLIIDQFIRDSIASGVDCVLNLGAGLDTRPYRLDLKADFLWIEADFPPMIKYKSEKLSQSQPRCKLERVAIDLSHAPERKKLFDQVAGRANKVLVITEGVLPYLSPENVQELAEDLRRHKQFAFWVVDYFSPEFLKMRYRRSMEKILKNAPFRFIPEDFWEFFRSCGWIKSQIRYLAEQGKDVNRRPLYPWWARVFMMFASTQRKTQISHMTGYVLLKRKE